MNDSLPAPPAWCLAGQLLSAPPAIVLDWLFDEGSLTRRLTALAGGAFSVRPLQEGWQILRDDECAALDAPAASEGWVREVLLCGQDAPWVFARSVATRAALEGSGLDLATLGSRSLGELLFCDQAFARGPLTACRYPRPWLPAPLAADGLWARRSCFRRNGLGLLVAEVFLPALWQRLDVST